jgi:hypothetical protein
MTTIATENRIPVFHTDRRKGRSSLPWIGQEVESFIDGLSELLEAIDRKVAVGRLQNRRLPSANRLRPTRRRSSATRRMRGT